MDLCKKYIGDNDATCPQLTCIRRARHRGRCDNIRGDDMKFPMTEIVDPKQFGRDFNTLWCWIIAIGGYDFKVFRVTCPGCGGESFDRFSGHVDYDHTDDCSFGYCHDCGGFMLVDMCPVCSKSFCDVCSEREGEFCCL